MTFYICSSQLHITYVINHDSLEPLSLGKYSVDG